METHAALVRTCTPKVVRRGGKKFAVQPGFDIDFGELSSVGGVEAAV